MVSIEGKKLKVYVKYFNVKSKTKKRKWRNENDKHTTIMKKAKLSREISHDLIYRVRVPIFESPVGSYDNCNFAIFLRPYRCLNIATLSMMPSNMPNMSSTTQIIASMTLRISVLWNLPNYFDLIILGVFFTMRPYY